MKSDCCVKLKSLGSLVLVVAVDDDNPILNDNEGLSNVDDEVVVKVDAAEVGLGNEKFRVLEVDFGGNKFANGLTVELSLVTDNLPSPDAVNELTKVKPEAVRAPLLEGCGMPNDICVLLDELSVLLSLSNLNVTDLAVVTAGLFNGTNPNGLPTRLLLPITGSTMEALSVSSSV